MRRHVCAGLLLVAVTGCALPPERLPLKPLPDDAAPLTYGDAVSRARTLASAANEAFYLNNWQDLEEAARGLDQTARFLGKATEVPVRHKDTLVVEAGDLGKEAGKLLEAAKARDVKLANDSLQRINLRVRELRAEK
jgi:hypothetical protein